LRHINGEIDFYHWRIFQFRNRYNGSFNQKLILVYLWVPNKHNAAKVNLWGCMSIIKQTLGRVVKSTNMPDLTKSFSPEQLAEAITAKRTGMKLTLVDVSIALSLSKPTLIKIEKGD